MRKRSEPQTERIRDKFHIWRASQSEQFAAVSCTILDLCIWFNESGSGRGRRDCATSASGTVEISEVRNSRLGPLSRSLYLQPLAHGSCHGIWQPNNWFDVTCPI